VTGRLIHPAVPHTPARHERWLTPLFKATNFAVFAALGGVSATARVAFHGAPTDASGRPAIFFSWHRFNYALALALRTLPPDARPTLLMHDGLASRALTHEASVWMGFETLVFRRRSPVSPRRQIIDHLRASRRNLLLLSDAGGPYGQVKPGLLEIAAACDAPLVPLVVRARGAIEVGRVLRHVLPWPFCELDVVTGAALDGPARTLEACQSALDALDPPPVR
jgi:lysophospholipid acyltransferase (LPLAT)-like uncharacterized protein